MSHDPEILQSIETTGLPKEELNKTKITELSLVAVKRSHILESRVGDSPRVQQKLTLCFNPRRFVQPVSTEITGLCNDLLEHEPAFNEMVFNTINNFLGLLSKPICLIAHNGITYDYPILKKHLIDLNVSFPVDLLCADSLHCFYDIDTKNIKNSSNIAVKEKKSEENIVDEDGFMLHSVDNKMQTENELTPKTHSCSSSKINGPRKRNLNMPGEISKVRRRIFFGDDSKPQKSYKLNNIYERYMNKSAVDAHRAENDCIMALECSVAKAEEFVQWVDNNHCLFSDVKSMTIGVPLGY